MALANRVTKAIHAIDTPRQWIQDDLLKKLFKNAGILLSGNIAASLLGLASLALTARSLGPENFGILVLISTYVTVVDRLVNFQSWQSLIKYGAEALEQGRVEDFKSLLKFGFLLDISTAIAGALIAATAARFVGLWQGWDSDTILMATFYSLISFFHIASTPTAILRLFDRFKLFSFIAIATAVIKLVGVSLAFVTDVGLWAFVFIWATTDIFGKILLIVLSLRVLKENHYINLRRSSTNSISTRFSGIWGFVITTNLNSSIRMTSREADILVIGAILGSSAVGLYKIAKQIANILTILSDPLYQSIYPELAKLRAQNDTRSLVKLAARSAVFSGILAILIWLALFFVAEPLIYHVFGREFVAAQGVMLWYMFAIVLAVLGFPLTPMILAFGKPHVAFWIYLLSTIVYFVALFFFVTNQGLVGAGMAYVAFYVIWSLLTLITVLIIIFREWNR